MHDTDVFVVGGGPAGLAAALALRARGFTVTVADAIRPPIDKACGEGLMPGSLAALRDLGVNITPTDGFAFRGVRFIGSGLQFAAEFPGGVGIGVRRTTLHTAMLGAAESAGARLLWGARVSGVSQRSVIVDGGEVRARWIIGADGVHSRVRVWAGLETPDARLPRFGFRRHYDVKPWSAFMELHWGAGAQIYMTPVGAGSVCVVLISRDPRLRFDSALPQFPEIAERLRDARPGADERGGVTRTRRLRAVHRGSVALIGDASGGVDAITGEGLHLVFQQAAALARAIEREDLAGYAAAHTRIARRPRFVANLLLALDRRPRLRDRVFRSLAGNPRIFGEILAMHSGDLSAHALFTNGIALTREMFAL